MGNFLPVKGLDLLIRALALAAKSMPEKLRLVLIGSGPLQQELTTLAEQCGLAQDALIWAGRKGAAEVAQFMRAADAVCLTSHNEGVPNVLLEALASGRAFVTTDVGGIGEVLKQAPAGASRLWARAFRLRHSLGAGPTSSPEPETLRDYMSRYAWPTCAQLYWKALKA